MNTSLKEFFEKISPELKTDKGTTHDYIDYYYDDVFTPYKETPIKLLEIGFFEGKSAKLWRNYFINGEIWVIDVYEKSNNSIDGVNHLWVDGYVQETLDMFENNTFDFIIDDGPHTLDSQLFFVKNWYSKLKIGGKLIIEDIQSSDDLNSLINLMSELNYNYKIYDLVSNKNRYDDIIIDITKN